MQIYVDADACPVVCIVEQIAEKHNVPCTLLCDTNHVWREDFEADEDGMLPADLKRGVLSEEGIYNLLTDYQRLSSKGRED